MKPDGWPDYCDRCPNWDASRERCDVFIAVNQDESDRRYYPILNADGVCRAYNWTPPLIGAYAQGRQRATP